MKKITSILAWILPIYLGMILIVSSIVLQNTFYKYLILSNFDANSNFTIVESNWHPLKPSIYLKDINLINKEQRLFVKDLWLEFSLMNLLRGNLISKINISEIEANYFQGNEEETLNFKGSLNFLTKIKELNLRNINISDGNKILMKGRLSFVRDKDGPSLELKLLDKKSNSMLVKVLSEENTSGALLRGHLSASNFLVSQKLISQFCKNCDFDGEINSFINFSFLQNELLNLRGNFDASLSKSLLGINAFSSSFNLKDSDSYLLQVSSFLNYDNTLRVPDFFVDLDFKNPVFIFPKIDLSKTKIINLLIQNYGLDINVKGELIDSFIDLNSDLFRSSFKDIEILSEVINVQGLAGQIKLDDGKSIIKISSPRVSVTAKNFLDERLSFDEFNSYINFNISSLGLEVFPSVFSGVFNEERLNGLFDLKPVPVTSLGDLNLRIRAEKINHNSAFLLFPNTPYLSGTKQTLKSLIGCGSAEGADLIYRGPVDRIYKDNSATFGLIGSAENMCININSYKIRDVSGDFRVNDFNFLGDLKRGNFLGSNIDAKIQTYKNEDNYFFRIEGNASGPFSSIIGLFEGEESQLTDVEGLHLTNYIYHSPLTRKIELLSSSSNLKISTEIKKGGFDISPLDFNIKNIFSSIQYDSADGLKEAFLSLKLNSIPLSFEIANNLSSPNYSVFSAKEIVQLRKFIPKSLEDKITGASQVFIDINVPSFKKGAKIKKSFIEFSSDLIGTNISLLDPFYKSKDEEISFNFQYYPSYTKDYSRLRFKYGDVLRGKLDLSLEEKQGYLIAGAEKQSITTEQGIISLIGTFEKFDLGLLNLDSQTFDDQSINFNIKNLVIKEVKYSDFIIPRSRIYSEKSKEYFALNVSNDDFAGKIYIPKVKGLRPLLNLDFLKIDLNDSLGDSTFLNIYNNLTTSFSFETDLLILNSNNYGKWKFDVEPSSDLIKLNNLEGIYGKWGLTSTSDGIASLEITKAILGWQTSLKSKIYSGSPEKGFKQFGINPNFEMDTISTDVDIYWNSLPWQISYKDILGEVSVNISGLLIQDREEIPTPNNLLRLINIFNITDSFEKVTNLDFRKLYQSGFGSDSVRGNFKIAKNSISISKPLIFRSGSSEFRWEGRIDKDDTGSFTNLNLEVVMTLPLREYLPAYAFLLGGPVTAGIVYIAGKAFERNLDQLSSGAWTVRGTLSDPKTDFSGWFETSKE